MEKEWYGEGYESAEEEADDDKSVFSDDEVENEDDGAAEEGDDGTDEEEDDGTDEDGDDGTDEEGDDAAYGEEESPRLHLLASLAAQARSAQRTLKAGNCTAYTEKNSQTWIDLEAVWLSHSSLLMSIINKKQYTHKNTLDFLQSFDFEKELDRIKSSVWRRKLQRFRARIVQEHASDGILDYQSSEDWPYVDAELYEDFQELVKSLDSEKAANNLVIPSGRKHGKIVYRFHYLRPSKEKHCQTLNSKCPTMNQFIRKANPDPSESILIYDVYPMQEKPPKYASGERVKRPKQLTAILEQRYGESELQAFRKFEKKVTQTSTLQVIFVLGLCDEQSFFKQEGQSAELIHSMTDQRGNSIWAALDDEGEITKLYILTIHTEYWIYNGIFKTAIVSDWLWEFGHALCQELDRLTLGTSHTHWYCRLCERKNGTDGTRSLRLSKSTRNKFC